MTIRDRVNIDDLLGMLKGVKKTSRGHMAFCPAHDDGQSHNYKGGQSLEVWDKDGFVKVKCYAGCPTSSILAALHLSKDDLAHSSQKSAKSKKASRTIAATYDYLDAGGRLLFQVVRFKPKGFSQRRPDGQGGWIWNLKGITPVLYHLPELKAAMAAGQTIYIVEGEQDADAARLLGLAATTSPMGAGKWRGEYTETLKGAAQLVLIPDNDEPGRCHMADIAAALHAQGTPVKLLEPLGERKGYDFSDWQAGGGKIEELEVVVGSTPLYSPVAVTTRVSLFHISDGRFSVDGNRIVYHTLREGQAVEVPLCNFTAHVKEEIIRDDGQKQSGCFKIAGSDHAGRPFPEIEVPFANFPSLSWALSQWGIRAMIEPFPAAERLLRGAMQLMSLDAPRLHIYTHTGWGHIDGTDAFLTPTGAIGADNVQVELEETLGRYEIPLPDPEDDIKKMIEASFNFLHVAKLDITLPLFAAMYMAPLNDAVDTNFNLWYVGGTGSLKTTISALALSHFGDFDTENVPAAWRDTQNKLERLLFICKDMPVLIDDWSPGQTAAQQKEFDTKADYVCRGQANRQGRGRLKSDTTSRKQYVPRGFLISTGEQDPPGGSNNARFLVVGISEADVDLVNLTTSQEERYLYRHAMGHYLAWLQSRWPEFRSELRAHYKEVFKLMARDLASANIHLRLPRSVTLLYLGLEMAIKFAEEQGATDALSSFVDESGQTDMSGAEYLLQKSRRVFLEMATRQGERVDSASPAKRFLLALNATLDSGEAYLDDKDATTPKIPGPRQTLVGWDDSVNGHIYLHKELVFKVVCEYYRGLGEPFVKRGACYMDLVNKGIIERGKDGKSSVVTYIPVLNKSRRVLKMGREYWDGDNQPSLFPAPSAEGGG